MKLVARAVVGALAAVGAWHVLVWLCEEEDWLVADDREVRAELDRHRATAS